MKDFSSQILEKLNKEYRLASKRSLKPREIWLVIGLCVGIMAGVLYAANVQFEFRSTKAATTITYQASTQFSGVQGQNRWWYLEWPSGAPLTYQPTNADCGVPCWKGSERYALIGNTWMVPGETVSVMRRWIADQAGTIQITSSGLPNVRMADTSGTSCGSSADGVFVSINRWQSASNTYTALWSQTLAWNNTTGYAFDLPNIQVVPGDLIDFFVTKGPGNNWCDWTYFDAKILLTTGGTSSSQPDLVVTGIRTEPANPVPGNVVKFYTTVQNNGAPVAAGSWVDVFFYVDGTPLVWTGGYPTATPVEFGPSFTAWTATAGTHTFKAAIDDDTADQIAESNETNNSFSKQVTIAAGTTLSCTGVRGPDSSTQILTSTNKTSGTLDFYAVGVQNAIAVTFPVWTEASGQDDLIWYPGVNQGGGIWKATADLAKHPDAGTVYMHVYMSEGTRWDFCGGIGFTKPALGSGGSGGSTVYQASTGFSSTQGANGWSYTDGNGALLTYDATNPDCPGCYKGSERYLLMSSSAQNPGQNASAVRWWKAPGDGTARITGSVKHIGGSCSDGVNVGIGFNFPASDQYVKSKWFNGEPFFSPGSEDSFDLTVSFKKGGQALFSVVKGPAGSNSNNFCDWTLFDPRIEFTPAIAAGEVTVSKAFLDVSPADGSSRIRLDGNSFMSGKLVTFNTVSVGNHSISVEVPTDTKVFYGICTNATTCKSDFKEAIVGPDIFTTPQFTVGNGTQNKISFLFTSPGMQYGSSIRPIRWPNVLGVHDAHAILSPASHWFDQETGDIPCSRDFTALEPVDDKLLTNFPNEALSWNNQTYIKIIPHTIKDALDKDKNTLPYTLTSGRPTYTVENFLLTKTKNIIAFTDKYTKEKTWKEGDAVGGARIFGYNPFIDNEGYVDYRLIVEARININPLAGDLSKTNVVKHELGHAIGLPHFLDPATPSVMFPALSGNNTIQPIDIQMVNSLYSHCIPKPAKLSISLTPNPLGATAARWQDTSNLAQCGPNGNRINTNGRWAGTLKIQENGGSDIVKLDRKVVKLYTGTTLKKTFDNSIDWGPFKKGSATSYPFYVLPNSKFIPTRVELTLYGVDQLGNRVESTAAMNLTGGKLLNKTCSGDSGGFPFGGVPIIIEVSEWGAS